MKFISLLGAGLVPLVLCAGCIVEHDDAPVRNNGRLVVDWSIDNSKDPGECHPSDSDAIEVTVSDLNGDVIGTYDQDCTAFAESITLQPGDYRASAVLVDSNGRTSTTAVPISRFTIYGGDELDIPIDFPADSFL